MQIIPRIIQGFTHIHFAVAAQAKEKTPII
jgi:hypothetical protein